jgi:hypothetical protein
MQQPNQASEVSLAFPPIVTTGFGSYYASTAVLAGYLRGKGVLCDQVDLNEDLAVYMLQQERLAEVASGRLADGPLIPADSAAISAARVLSMHLPLLFEGDKHCFRGGASLNPAFMLSTLMEPFAVDLPVPQLLVELDQSAWWARFYTAFYQQSGFAERLGAAIHTVGLSVAFGQQLGPAVVLARTVKRVRPDVRVVVGGPTLSLLSPPNIALLLEGVTEIDAIERFEGEVPLGHLVAQQREGCWQPVGIPGVTARGDAGVVETPPTQGVRLDELPYPEYDPSLLHRLWNPKLSIVQARGCYWGRCTYCDYVELYDGSPSYRTRRAENFVDEMEFQVQKYGLNNFAIITEAIPPAFSRKISEEILRRGINVKWWSFAMVEKHYTPELFALMARAGCSMLTVGVETMTDRVLHLVEKSATCAENVRFIKDAHAAGLKIHVNIIPDLPSTTYQEAKQSLELFSSLEDCFAEAAVFPFAPTQSSQIGRAPARFGLVVLNEPTSCSQGDRQSASNRAQVVDPAMTADQRVEIQDAFRTFGERVNVGSILTSLGLERRGASRYRFAHEFVSCVEAEDGWDLLSWVTGTVVNLEPKHAEMLQFLRETSSYSLAEVSARFGMPEDELALLVEQLILVAAKTIAGERHASERTNVVMS